MKDNNYYKIITNIVASCNKEKTASEWKNRYEIALYGSNSGIFEWNIETNSCYITPIWQKKVLGKEDLILNIDDYKSIIKEVDLTKFKNILAECIANKKTNIDFEHRILNTSKKYRWLHLKANIVLDNTNKKLIGYISDIHTTKVYETKIKNIEDRLDQAQKISKTGNWHWSYRDNKITLSSSIFFILGEPFHHKYVNKEYLINFIHPEDLDNFTNIILLSIQDKTEFNIEHRAIKKDSSIIYVKTIGKCSYKNNIPYYVIGTTRDITEEKELDLKLKEQEKIILTQSRQAAMGEMISMIAHQWRQPISTIGMAVNNMTFSIQTDDYNKKIFLTHLNDISNQVQYLSKTINDFRNFLLENRKKENTNPSLLIEKTQELIHKSLINNGIKLENNIQFNPIIYLNINETIQVFLNLIKNSKDAILEKKIKNGIIIIDIYKDKNFIVFSFEDNGGGMEKNVANRIFEPYFTTKDEQNGTGLGLYMSKEIVEKKLNGKIKYIPKNNGTIFKIFLPLDELTNKE